MTAFRVFLTSVSLANGIQMKDNSDQDNWTLQEKTTCELRKARFCMLKFATRLDNNGTNDYTRAALKKTANKDILRSSGAACPQLSFEKDCVKTVDGQYGQPDIADTQLMEEMKTTENDYWFPKMGLLEGEDSTITHDIREYVDNFVTKVKAGNAEPDFGGATTSMDGTMEFESTDDNLKGPSYVRAKKFDEFKEEGHLEKLEFIAAWI